MTLIATDTTEDAPSGQGFRSVLRCRWVQDQKRGGLRAVWEEALELVPVAPRADA